MEEKAQNPKPVEKPAAELQPRELTIKQRAFIEAYLACWNATEAARRAGYKHPDVQGPRLLGNVRVRAAIEERLTGMAMSANEVLARLAEHARGSMVHFITLREDGGWTVDLQKAAAAGVLHLVKSVEQKKDGVKLELYSAQEALALLGKHHRLFVERLEHSGPDGGPIVGLDLTGLSDEELFRLLANLERAGGAADEDSPGTAPPAGGEAGAGAGPAGVDDPAPASPGAGSAV